MLGVTALGDTIADAKDRAYEAVARIHFQDAYCRTDIGQKAIGRLGVRGPGGRQAPPSSGR